MDLRRKEISFHIILISQPWIYHHSKQRPYDKVLFHYSPDTHKVDFPHESYLNLHCPWNLVLKRLDVVIQKHEHMILQTLLVHTHTHRRAHTHTHSQHLAQTFLHYWPWYTAHSASPHCNLELQLIRAQDLFLAAAQPRCAALGRNHPTSVIWLSPPLPGFSSGSRVAELGFLPASPTFTPFSSTWEKLVHFTCC